MKKLLFISIYILSNYASASAVDYKRVQITCSINSKWSDLNHLKQDLQSKHLLMDFKAGGMEYNLLDLDSFNFNSHLYRKLAHGFYTTYDIKEFKYREMLDYGLLRTPNLELGYTEEYGQVRTPFHYFEALEGAKVKLIVGGGEGYKAKYRDHSREIERENRRDHGKRRGYVEFNITNIFIESIVKGSPIEDRVMSSKSSLRRSTYFSLPLEQMDYEFKKGKIRVYFYDKDTSDTYSDLYIDIIASCKANTSLIRNIPNTDVSIKDYELKSKARKTLKECYIDGRSSHVYGVAKLLNGHNITVNSKTFYSAFNQKISKLSSKVLKKGKDSLKGRRLERKLDKITGPLIEQCKKESSVFSF